MIQERRIRAKPHLFMPGETISAAIKKYNFYSVTPEEMQQLLKDFTQINGEVMFRPGMNGLIPVLEKHQDKAFT